MNAFAERLTQTGIQAVVELIVMAALAAGAAILARNMVQRGRVRVENGAGHTCMSPYALLVAVLCGLMAAACLALGLFDPESLREPGQFYAWMGLIGGFSLAFLGILRHTRQTWEWDREGLRWRGAWREKSMRWSDLARAGKSWDGQFYVADKAGKKIRWSTYTLEHEALARAIAAARPDLDVPLV